MITRDLIKRWPAIVSRQRLKSIPLVASSTMILTAKFFLCMLLILSVGITCARAQSAAAPLGIYVDSHGVLMREGAAYRGVGVNYFDALYRMLNNRDISYREGFTYLKAHHIPFIRFMGGGYWPSQWELYKTNKSEYFARFDDFVKDAERAELGLIPSLFWQVNTIPDIVGEPVGQWGNPDSKTIAFMREYTREVVTRYKDSPAIWAWEFGNEMNLNVDLKNHVPQVAVQYGTPAERSAADRLSTADMNVALVEFGKTVRSIDASRLILSGNSQPRPDAQERMAKYGKDSEAVNYSTLTNSLAQLLIGLDAGSAETAYKKMLLIQNPDPLDSLSIHLYPDQEFKHLPPPGASLEEIVDITMDASEEMKKPLFIGEFGVPVMATTETERMKFQDFLWAIKWHKVPLSALWVFDYSQQANVWNVSSDNERRYQLERIGKLNLELQEEDRGSTVALVRHWRPELPLHPHNLKSSDNWANRDSIATMNWLTSLRDAWLAEPSGYRKSVMGELLWNEAKTAYYDEYLDEVTGGDVMSETEITDPATTVVVPLTLVKALPDIPVDRYPQRIFRKVGSSAFECWTTSTGYLFNRSGQLINKTHIKRKDGGGREWFGSFLDSGAYCTTDIWNHDKQLHVFSRNGKWIKSIKTPCTVAWARADKQGKRWIARSSNDKCEGIVIRVSEDGIATSLKRSWGDYLDWREVGPIRRDLFIDKMLANDSGSHLLTKNSANHGRGAMFDHFRLYKTTGTIDLLPATDKDASAPIFSRTIYQAWQYGFYRDSLAWWASGDEKTWIMRPDGTAAGWISGEELGDAAEPSSHLFRAHNGTVLEVNNSGKMVEKRRFTVKGQTAYPAWLLDERRLGFFEVSGELILAKW